MPETLRRQVEWTPGYNRKEEGYGIHGAAVRFLLHGPKGVVQFLIYTNWMPRSCRPDSNEHIQAFLAQPMAVDLGYHSPVAQYEGQEPRDCNLLPGGHCFYDGSSLSAEPVLDLLIEEGEEAVWTQLKERYEDLADA